MNVTIINSIAIIISAVSLYLVTSGFRGDVESIRLVISEQNKVLKAYHEVHKEQMTYNTSTLKNIEKITEVITK